MLLADPFDITNLPLTKLTPACFVYSVVSFHHLSRYQFLLSLGVKQNHSYIITHRITIYAVRETRKTWYNTLDGGYDLSKSKLHYLNSRIYTIRISI